MRSLICLFAGLILAGCATPPRSLPWVPPIQQARAGFLWKHSGGTLAGEAEVTSDAAGNVAIRLTKSLPSPLLELSALSQGTFRATGPIAGGGWSGEASRAPSRFALWTALAAAWRGAERAKDGRQEVHTATYRAAVWKESGTLRELSVSSSDNGEVIRFVFR
jgi:hypothetical protein